MRMVLLLILLAGCGKDPSVDLIKPRMEVTPTPDAYYLVAYPGTPDNELSFDYYVVPNDLEVLSGTPSSGHVTLTITRYNLVDVTCTYNASSDKYVLSSCNDEAVVAGSEVHAYGNLNLTVVSDSTTVRAVLRVAPQH